MFYVNNTTIKNDNNKDLSILLCYSFMDAAHCLLVLSDENVWFPYSHAANIEILLDQGRWLYER